MEQTSKQADNVARIEGENWQSKMKADAVLARAELTTRLAVGTCWTRGAAGKGEAAGQFAHARTSARMRSSPS